MNLRAKRNLKYWYEECLLSVRLVLKLIKKIADLKVEQDVLKSYVQSLQIAAPNSNVSLNRKTTIPEDNSTETYERQQRMCNV